MLASELIRSVRSSAGLTLRALAARARTSAPALVEYEAGRRDPTLSTLQRIVAAAGADLTLATRAITVDRTTNGRILEEVLELAEHLPRRAPDPHLTYPRLPRLPGPR